MGVVKRTHPLSCWWGKQIKKDKRRRDKHRGEGIYYKVFATTYDIRHFDYGKR